MAPLRRPQQHEKIAEYLRKEIRDGTYEPGDTLPSEAELCAQFDSSRGPVRQAMSTLRSEGLISSGRGRRSVALDLKSPAGRDAFLALVRQADVVIENLRPGAMARLGLDAAALQAVVAAAPRPAATSPRPSPRPSPASAAHRSRSSPVRPPAPPPTSARP